MYSLVLFAAHSNSYVITTMLIAALALLMSLFILFLCSALEELAPRLIWLMRLEKSKRGKKEPFR